MARVLGIVREGGGGWMRWAACGGVGTHRPSRQQATARSSYHLCPSRGTSHIERLTSHVSHRTSRDHLAQVNVDLYPVQAGDSLSLTLVSTLNQDGSGMPVGDPGQQVYDPSVPFRSTNADDYEYVMFGKVFKYKDARRKGGSDTVNAEVFASFGGLLMHLSGTPDRLKELDVDQSLYLMIRKVA